MKTRFTVACVALLITCLVGVAAAQDAASQPAAEPAEQAEASAQQQAATAPESGPATQPAEAHAEGRDSDEPARPGVVKLPGLQINFEQQYVDVEAEICIERGALELIACTPGTKEHESIVTVAARPMHIHTALLLLGLKNGHPATRRPINEEKTRWVFLPPRGQLVEVSLVIQDNRGDGLEFPISDFVTQTDGADAFAPEPVEPVEEGPEFPDAFIFAGSVLHKTEEGEQVYIADRSGHVISVSTFGDELLCLPEVVSQDNQALLWKVDTTALPEVGTKVTLRLRPHQEREQDMME